MTRISGQKWGGEPYEQLIRRSQIVSQSLGQFHHASDGGEEGGSGFDCPPGDFHHFYSSISQDVSGGVPQRFHQGRESISVQKNITVRDSKRSKSRLQDREYQRRVSFTPGAALQSIGAGFLETTSRQVGGSASSPHLAGYHEGLGVKTRQISDSVRASPVLSLQGSQRVYGPSPNPMSHQHGGQLGREMSPDQDVFTVTLTFDGQLCQHRVTADMAVLTLVRDAAQIYGLVALDVILVLFGMLPRSLVRGKLLSDPPQVNPGSTILVFNVPNSGFFPVGQPQNRAGQMHLHPDGFVKVFRQF
jgi:hypothetical protein